eukprot:SAG22_NODE_2719_length_2283_cov_50.240385_3_plen_80_part_00
MLSLKLCGKAISINDQRLWKQALAQLNELSVRNSISEKRIGEEVTTQLLEKRQKERELCEDCRLHRSNFGMPAEGTVRW